jgi:hypothetical protein
MNTITKLVALLTLWLVMGLGFLAEYVTLRRKGFGLVQALKQPEGWLLLASLVLPLVLWSVIG